MPRPVVLLATLLITAHPALAQTPAGIDSVYARFSRAYATLDTDLIRSLYTDDCKYLPGGAPSVQSCDEALAGFDYMFTSADTAGRSLDIDFRLIDRGVDGDLAYDVGYYGLRVAEADGSERMSYGKFVTVVKRQPDGTWKFHVDGFGNATEEAWKAAEN